MKKTTLSRLGILMLAAAQMVVLAEGTPPKIAPISNPKALKSRPLLQTNNFVKLSFATGELASFDAKACQVKLADGTSLPQDWTDISDADALVLMRTPKLFVSLAYLAGNGLLVPAKSRITSDIRYFNTASSPEPLVSVGNEEAYTLRAHEAASIQALLHARWLEGKTCAERIRTRLLLLGLLQQYMNYFTAYLSDTEAESRAEDISRNLSMVCSYCSDPRGFIEMYSNPTYNLQAPKLVFHGMSASQAITYVQQLRQNVYNARQRPDLIAQLKRQEENADSDTKAAKAKVQDSEAQLQGCLKRLNENGFSLSNSLAMPPINLSDDIPYQPISQPLKRDMENAAKEYAFGQFALGMRYLKGDGLPPDETIAREWLEKAAAQGYTDAQLTVMILSSGGNLENKSLRNEITFAEKGMADYQYALGMRYLNGNGVATNNALARQWLEKAAAQGNAGAKDALNQLAPDPSK